MPPKKAKVLSLTQALSQLLEKTLLPDLEARAEEPEIGEALRQQYEAEKNAERTAEIFREFVARTLEQVGAAWILSCVFVRVLEDRGLLSRNRIAGAGAADSDQLFFELAPSLTMRDYLLTVFQEVASLPGAAEVLGPRHNPAFRFSPSNEGARALLDFFREEGADGLRWRFAGDDTRFLGDLYQDLSEDVRKRYALLQTPTFVEAFILEHTLGPAIAEFGLEDVRVIDPTCGSGHFLLGAFERLLDERLRRAPGVDVRTHALSALAQVYGVDVNPYAVAIARFRLTLAYLSRCGFTRLAQAPKLQLNLVVADSLLHGADKTTLNFVEHASARGDERAWGLSMFALDDPEEAQRVFSQRYHAVVGNPPYITCKDAKLREKYRDAYTSAAGKYALAAPFTERFFQLAVDGGYVGMINANSFMKREFGKALIEQVLKHKDLSRVIDTAGAYIPGHGTPTVLLFGRNRQPASEHVHAVLGKRGEPSTPDNAEQGHVWRSIADHLDEIGFENEYVTVAQVPRATLDKHPWSLGGGGAAELKELLEERADKTLGDVAEEIGFASFTGLDDAFVLPPSVARTLGIEPSVLRPMVTGEDIRDWSISNGDLVITPYDKQTHKALAFDQSAKWARFLWRYRTAANSVASFGGKSRADEGQNWWQWYRWQTDRYLAAYRITYAEVAPQNHFVLDSGGKVLNRTAPIIKLPETATEDDHLEILAYLNSSVAGFYLRQVAAMKQMMGADGVRTGDAAATPYQLGGKQLATFPYLEYAEPWRSAAVSIARELVRLGNESSADTPHSVLNRLEGPQDLDDLEDAIAQHRGRSENRLSRMVFLQEELDWVTYVAWRLAPAHLASTAPNVSTRLSPGRRVYETRLARDTGVTKTADGFRSAEDIPELPPDARGVYEERLRFLSSDSMLRILEAREYKRRWVGRLGIFGAGRHTRQRSFESAARELLLTAAQQRCAVVQIGRALAHAYSLIEDHPVLLRAAQLDTDVSVCELLLEAAVPFVDSQVYSLSGLTKRRTWMNTWAHQRRVDEGQCEVPELETSPEPYSSKDFQSAIYWRLRGKLDVPKERFISYPGCQKDGDDSPLIGWAGWNHLQRAQALIALYQERKLEDGWPKERLMPMLVGLHELMFWLELWHSKPEAGSDNPAREIRQYLDAELNAHKLTAADLEAWRPSDTKKPRKTKSKVKADHA